MIKRIYFIVQFILLGCAVLFVADEMAHGRIGGAEGIVVAGALVLSGNSIWNLMYRMKGIK